MGKILNSHIKFICKWPDGNGPEEIAQVNFRQNMWLWESYEIGKICFEYHSTPFLPYFAPLKLP